MSLSAFRKQFLGKEAPKSDTSVTLLTAEGAELKGHKIYSYLNAQAKARKKAAVARRAISAPKPELSVV